MIHARVVGTGSFLPGEPVSNNDLVARGIDTSDEWIVERTGIRRRHLAEPDVTASQLAYEAATRAIAAAGCQPSDIDLIIVATSTPDYIFPSTAALLQARLGIANGGAAFDLQAVCTGFAYAPLSVLAFVTLPPQLRNEGAAMFSLLRNLGSSIGISIVVALLMRNTQIMHARLGERIQPYGTELNGLTPGMLGDSESLMRLNDLVTAQAALVAYNNDFVFLMVLSLCLVPLVVLLKPAQAAPKPATGGGK